MNGFAIRRRHALLLAGAMAMLAAMPGQAAEPSFRGRLDAAGARRLAAFAKTNIDQLCRIEITVDAKSSGGSAGIEEDALIVRAEGGKLEFRFPAASIRARGKIFRAGGLLTPLRGEPETGLVRYDFNMLG